MLSDRASEVPLPVLRTDGRTFAASMAVLAVELGRVSRVTGDQSVVVGLRVEGWRRLGRRKCGSERPRAPHKRTLVAAAGTPSSRPSSEPHSCRRCRGLAPGPRRAVWGRVQRALDVRPGSPKRGAGTNLPPDWLSRPVGFADGDLEAFASRQRGSSRPQPFGQAGWPDGRLVRERLPQQRRKPPCRDVIPS